MRMERIPDESAENEGREQVGVVLVSIHPYTCTLALGACAYILHTPYHLVTAALFASEHWFSLIGALFYSGTTCSTSAGPSATP